MKLRQPISLRYRLAAVAASVGVAAGATGGEPIRFSKPAVPIAVEAKGNEGLPAPRDKRPDFGAASMAPPAVPQSTIVRVQPHERKKDADSERHWLLRDPRNFPDATGRANAREALANGRDPDRRDFDSTRRDSLTQDQTQNGSQWSTDGSSLGRPEGARALSPIADFHWDARNDRRSNSWSGTHLSNSDKTDSLNSNPFGRDLVRDESSEQKAEAGSSFFSDLFAPRSKEKEKSMEAQLERRAAYERLINLNTTIASRTGGSLEPVIAVENPKAVAPAATMPSIVSPRLDSNPLQPMDAFNQRQGQLRAPVAVDFNKKYNNATPAAPAPVGPATDPHQAPLMRQPTVRDLPSRKF